MNITCEQCDNVCRETIRVVCQTYQQVIQQITGQLLNVCSTQEPSPTNGFDKNCTTPQSLVTLNDMSQESSQCTACSNVFTSLGAVSGILVTLLMATVVGWMVTCVAWRRSAALKRRMFLK